MKKSALIDMSEEMKLVSIDLEVSISRNTGENGAIQEGVESKTQRSRPCDVKRVAVVSKFGYVRYSSPIQSRI